MSFFDRLRNWLSAPQQIKAEGEEAAALHEEYGTSDAAKADVERLEYGDQGGPVPGLAGRDAAEVAESEIESEEAPPGP